MALTSSQNSPQTKPVLLHILSLWPIAYRPGCEVQTGQHDTWSPPANLTPLWSVSPLSHVKCSQSEPADFVLLIVNVLQHPATTTRQSVVFSLLGGGFSVDWREPPVHHRGKLSHRELPSALPALCNRVRCSTRGCCPARGARTSLVASILEVVGQMKPLTPCSYRNCPVIAFAWSLYSHVCGAM